MADNTRTSATLVNQLSDPDNVIREAAWKTVFEKYESRLTAWALKTKAKDDQVQELIHQTWVALWGGMDSFQYDPSKSFRAYLRTVITNQASKFLRQRRRESDFDPEAFAAIEDQNLRTVDHVIVDAEREIAVLEIRDRVRQQVNERDWQIWEARQLHQQDVDDLATAHDSTAANVYKIVSRINKVISTELAKLNEHEV